MSFPFLNEAGITFFLLLQEVVTNVAWGYIVCDIDTIN